MSVKSKLIKVVASQIGPLQAKLRSEIQKKVLELLKEFASGCPNQAKLLRIIKIKNNLLRNINSFQKRVDQVKKLPNSLKPVISTAKIALQIISSIPIPTAVPPGAGIPISILNRYSKAINTISKTIDVLEGDVSSVNTMINSVSGPISSLQKRLQSLDIKIQQCSNGDPAIIAEAQPKENTGTEGTPNSDYLYKGYTLEILQDPNSPKIAPRRYALARNKLGIVVIIGESSFSSSTQVLLDELKFKIDNQLI
jgi:prefoldin subunit 5